MGATCCIRAFNTPRSGCRWIDWTWRESQSGNAGGGEGELVGGREDNCVHARYHSAVALVAGPFRADQNATVLAVGWAWGDGGRVFVAQPSCPYGLEDVVSVVQLHPLDSGVDSLYECTSSRYTPPPERLLAPIALTRRHIAGVEGHHATSRSWSLTAGTILLRGAAPYAPGEGGREGGKAT